MPLDVHVVTPERELWAGEANMVIARGVEGEVGILSGHAPLLIRLAIGHVRIFTETERIAAVVDGGFLHVTSEGMRSRVDVLASFGELSHEIDFHVAELRRHEAEERVREHGTAEARAELAKALSRLSLRG